MPNHWFIDCLAVAQNRRNCSSIHYYQISIIAFINWQPTSKSVSRVCSTSSHDGHVFKKKLNHYSNPDGMLGNKHRIIQLQQVPWLTLYHSFLLLTRRPARHDVAFYFLIPQEVFCPEINWRKIWRRYFILLLFYWTWRCSPWLLIHRCSEMNPSHFYHTVFARGLIAHPS